MAYSPLINRTLMSTIAQVKDQVNRIWYASFQTDLADTLAAHLRRHALAGVQAALEMALVEELEVHRQPYRQHVLPIALQRSGTYTRRVLTTHGFIPDLHVPKLRGDNHARTWQVLTRYQLSMPLLLDQALYLYTLGLSIRDLQEALYVLFGHVLSREAVNRVTRAAQSPMDTWRTQPITDTPPILLVDGVWGQVLQPTGAVWIDQSGHERREMRGVDQVILTVMGVWPDGRHQIIHYQLAAAEDTAAWSALLTTLIERGLDAATVQMVVSDGSTGLPAALATHLPDAKQQRCVVHKIRGLERAFCYRDLTLIDSVTGEPLTYEAARRQRRQQLSTDAHAIFEAPTRAEADARLAAFRATWGGREAEVVRLLAKDIDACLTFYQFDQPLHRLVRSTNLLERFFREFRTKSDEIGAFPNDMSCLVVFHLIVIRDDAKHDRGHTAKTG
jgi:transposase-like protein